MSNFQVYRSPDNAVKTDEPPPDFSIYDPLVQAYFAAAYIADFPTLREAATYADSPHALLGNMFLIVVPSDTKFLTTAPKSGLSLHSSYGVGFKRAVYESFSGVALLDRISVTGRGDEVVTGRPIRQAETLAILAEAAEAAVAFHAALEASDRTFDSIKHGYLKLKLLVGEALGLELNFRYEPRETVIFLNLQNWVSLDAIVWFLNLCLGIDFFCSTSRRCVLAILKSLLNRASPFSEIRRFPENEPFVYLSGVGAQQSLIQLSRLLNQSRLIPIPDTERDQFFNAVYQLLTKLEKIGPGEDNGIVFDRATFESHFKLTWILN